MRPKSASVVAQIAAAGGRAVALQADVSDEAEVVAMFQRMDEAHAPAPHAEGLEAFQREHGSGCGGRRLQCSECASRRG